MPKFNEVMGNLNTKIEQTAKQEPAKKAILQMPKEPKKNKPKKEVFNDFKKGDKWSYGNGAFVEVNNVAGNKFEITTPSGVEWVTREELDEITKLPRQEQATKERIKRSIREDLRNNKAINSHEKQENKNPDEDEILRESFDGDFIAKLRAEDADNMERRGDKEAASYIRNMSHKEVVDHYIDNYGIDKLKKLAEERNGINQDRVNLLSKGKPLAELREKFGSKLVKPTRSTGLYWGYEDPDTKYMTRHPTEIDALRYAEQKEDMHQKWVADEGERILSDFKKGIVTAKDLKQLGRSQYAADIIAYLLNRIK